MQDYQYFIMGMLMLATFSSIVRKIIDIKQKMKKYKNKTNIVEELKYIIYFLLFSLTIILIYIGKHNSINDIIIICFSIIIIISVIRNYKKRADIYTFISLFFLTVLVAFL